MPATAVVRRCQIDAGDHEAEAVLDLAVGFPGQIGDLIVTKSAGFNDFGHGDLPIDFRGGAAPVVSAGRKGFRGATLVA